MVWQNFKYTCNNLHLLTGWRDVCYSVHVTEVVLVYCHSVWVYTPGSQGWGCDLSILLQDRHAVVDCVCKVSHKTGVEMEALTGASVAALTIYDMCKALSHDIVIEDTRLITKTGGKQDFHHDE